MRAALACLNDGASVLEMRDVSEHEHGDPRPTMKTAEAIEDSARIRRLTEFATDALDLADRRADLDLRALLDDLYRDLIELEEER